MPYILTPTGWRVLNEESGAGYGQRAQTERALKLATDRGLPPNAKNLISYHISPMMPSGKQGMLLDPKNQGHDAVVIQGGHGSHHYITTDGELAAKIKKLAGDGAHHHRETGFHHVKVYQSHAEGVRDALKKLNESQIELLESLYEDGYLSENRLKKVLGGIARGAAHVASGAAGVLPGGMGGRRAAKAAHNLDNFADRMGEEKEPKRINESQIELLESLYEDGYLTEEQLDEIFGKIVDMARDVRSGYLRHRARHEVRRSGEQLEKARRALERAEKKRGNKKAMDTARLEHAKAKLANQRAKLANQRVETDRAKRQQNLNKNSQ